MKKLLTVSAIALALIAGPLVNTASAGMYTAVGVSSSGAIAGGGFLAVVLHLLANANVKDGSLRAKADPVMESFQANARQFQGTPAYAFVDTGTAIAAVK